MKTFFLCCYLFTILKIYIYIYINKYSYNNNNNVSSSSTSKKINFKSPFDF